MTTLVLGPFVWRELLAIRMLENCKMSLVVDISNYQVSLGSRLSLRHCEFIDKVINICTYYLHNDKHWKKVKAFPVLQHCVPYSITCVSVLIKHIG